MGASNEKISRKLCIAVLETVASGVSGRKAAKQHNITEATVRRIRKMDPDDFASTFERGGDNPFDRLQAIRDQFLTLAEGSLGGGDNPLNVSVGNARQAAQSAVELHRYVESVGALPELLPGDDEEARQAVKECWYQAARNGSPTAAAKLAAAFGVRTLQQQGSRMEFGRPNPDDYPAATTPSPGGSSKLN